MAKVSIISPCYNSEKYLQDMIDSVIAQSYQDWELILINDNSTDKTLDVINANLKIDNRLILVDLKANLGVANARNEGIRSASGKYIAFLDSDDLWDGNKLAVQVPFMVKNDVSICYSAYRKIDSTSAVIAHHIKVRETGVTYGQLLRHNEIGCLTAIYDTEKLGKHYFIKVGHEDFVYWLTLLKQGNTAYGINTPLATYRVHGKSISSNKLKAAGFTWHIYRQVERLSMPASLLNFTMYAFLSLKKYISK